MTTNPRCRQYLEGFHKHALEAGLQPSEPKGTNNYVRFPAMGASHIGVSVTSDRLRVNLNNDTDLDRSIFNMLISGREDLERQTGVALDWEDRDPERQKSVVRAASPGGYISEQDSWPTQYAWAVNVVKAFETEYRARI